MISSRDASRTPRRLRLIFQSRDRLHRYHAFTLIACAIFPRLVTSCRGVEASCSTQRVAKQPSVRVASIIHLGAPPVFRSTGQRQCLMRQCPVAPPGFCNGGSEVWVYRWSSEYEVPQSRLYCLCINVALCSTALQCICRVIRRSSTTMKAHTYYIIFGRTPPAGGATDRQR